jgi:hypothetical protein
VRLALRSLHLLHILIADGELSHIFPVRESTDRLFHLGKYEVCIWSAMSGESDWIGLPVSAGIDVIFNQIQTRLT